MDLERRFEATAEGKAVGLIGPENIKYFLRRVALHCSNPSLEYDPVDRLPAAIAGGKDDVQKSRHVQWWRDQRLFPLMIVVEMGIDR